MLFVLCQTQDSIFAADADHIVEIIRMVQLTRLPSEEERLDGLINYRGNMIPVMDSNRYLQQQAVPYGADSTMIVFSYANQNFVVVLDEVMTILDVSKEDLIAYEAIEQEYFHAALQHETRIYPVLNLKRLTQDIRTSLQSV